MKRIRKKTQKEKTQKQQNLWRQTTHEEAIKNIKKMNLLLLLLLWVRCFPKSYGSGSGDDDDDDIVYVFVFSYECVCVCVYTIWSKCVTYTSCSRCKNSINNNKTDSTKLETKWVETIRLRGGITVFFLSVSLTRLLLLLCVVHLAFETQRAQEEDEKEERESNKTIGNIKIWQNK